MESFQDSPEAGPKMRREIGSPKGAGFGYANGRMCSGKEPRLELHAPLAVHEVAFVLDQLSVLLPPLGTLVGLALNDTVGTGTLGVTVTVTDWLALPPVPVQLSV